MLDPVIGSILFGIAGVAFLVGAYSAYQHQPRQTEGSRFRQRVILARIPVLLVFLPTAVSSVLVYLFIGRAGGPPSTSVRLLEIGGVLLILGATIGGSTLVGSIVGGFLQQTLLQE